MEYSQVEFRRPGRRWASQPGHSSGPTSYLNWGSCIQMTLEEVALLPLRLDPDRPQNRPLYIQGVRFQGHTRAEFLARLVGGVIDPSG